MPADAKPADLEADFLHINSVDYNPALDQIVLSVPELGEAWILDHGTTSAQARASSGGKRGRGGEILYRWGNPSSYGRGATADRVLGYQHDARWIPPGTPGAGRLTIFNNHAGGPESKFSAVEEINPPLLAAACMRCSKLDPTGRLRGEPLEKMVPGSAWPGSNRRKVARDRGFSAWPPPRIERL